VYNDVTSLSMFEIPYLLSKLTVDLLMKRNVITVTEDTPLEAVSLFVDAIQQADVRAIIQGWDVGMKQLTLPPTIYPARSLPHSWLLPHCAGVVHHGGYGTTSAGLRAGIPALVIPHITDQFFWSQKVHELGVGLPPIARGKLDCTQKI